VILVLNDGVSTAITNRVPEWNIPSSLAGVITSADIRGFSVILSARTAFFAINWLRCVDGVLENWHGVGLSLHVD
jgi:hypothetical protein